MKEKQEKLEREAKEKVDALNLRNKAEFAEQLFVDVDPIPGFHLPVLHQQSSSREDLDELGNAIIFEQSVVLEAFLKEVEQEADEDEIVDKSFDEEAGEPLLPLRSRILSNVLQQPEKVYVFVTFLKDLTCKRQC